MDEMREGLPIALRGLREGGDDGMGAGVPVAGSDLASDYRATQLLFREVVGGRDLGVVEGIQELQAVLAQVLRELAVFWLGEVGAEESLNLNCQVGSMLVFNPPTGFPTPPQPTPTVDTMKHF